MMFWRRVLRFGSRLGLVVLASVFLLGVSLRAYVHYEVHRATALQAEACRVQIGDAEPTVFPLIDRYSGFKWTPDSLGPRENWIDKEEYDYQKSLESDYRYYLAVSPYKLLANDVRSGQSRADRTVRAVMNNTSVQLRSVLGMRDWNASKVGLDGWATYGSWRMPCPTANCKAEPMLSGQRTLTWRPTAEA